MASRRLRAIERDSELSDPASDGELLRRIAAGDESALRAVIARYGPSVRRYLGHLLSNRSWADELGHETFVRLYENAGGYDERWDLPVWLFTIARNLAVDLRRRERRRSKRLEDQATPPAVVSAPPEELACREFQGAFETALRELPEAFRSVFVLKEIEGLSYARIATVLDTSVKTVSSRLHRARLRLQKSLARYLEP